MKSVKLVLNNKDSADISELLDLTLQQLNYSREQIVHYTFLTENALYEWRTRLPENQQVMVYRKDTRHSVSIIITVRGKRYDPFDVEKNTEMALSYMIDRLLSGVGSEIKYKYSRGENCLIMSFPRKNSETRLFLKNLLILSFPVIIQSLFQELAINMDGLILGFMDSSSMSVVSLVNRFNDIHIYMTLGMVTTVTALVSQFWGRRDRLNSGKILGITLKMSLYISIPFIVLALLCPEQIMKLYTDIPELIDIGIPYIRSIALTYLLVPIYRILYSIMAVTGRLRKSVMYAMIGCTINLLLDMLLIPGYFGLPSLGIIGAGLARVVSGILQVVLVLIDSRNNSPIRADMTVSLMHDTCSSMWFKVALPALLQYITWAIALSIYSATIGHINADIISAHSLLMIVFNTIVSIVLGIGNGCSILMGNTLGKGKTELAKQRLSLMLKVGTVLGIVFSISFVLIVFLFSIAPISMSEEAKALCLKMSYFYAVNLFSRFVNVVFMRGALYAGGDTKGILIIDIITNWIILVPIAIFGLNIGIPAFAVVVILNMGEAIALPLRYIRVKQGQWIRNVTASITLSDKKADVKE